MEFKSIHIVNYKSVQDVYLPINKYGNGSKKSYSTIFVGLNETGKSNVLEAINVFGDKFQGLLYNDIVNKEKHGENIEVKFEVQLKGNSEAKEDVLDYLIAEIFAEKEDDLWDKLNVQLRKAEINCVFTRSMADNGEIIEICECEVLGTFPYEEYLYKGLEIKPYNEELVEEYAQLTEDSFIGIVNDRLLIELHFYLPQVQYWTPSEQFLINSPIDLNQFIADPNISRPLVNIFRIYGLEDIEKIKAEITAALANDEKKSEMEEVLSEKVTKHVNRIWKEHKINFKIKIDGHLCKVHVEDKDKRHSFYKMGQRSGGFQQFVSLILSLSTLNENKSSELLILLDEPEMRMHPSGIREMRNELVKIGKKNYLIISTHSHYMVDEDTPERHWVVSKEKMNTSIEQFNTEMSMLDDEVLKKAFGINVYKELLPSNIIAVEGEDDKIVLNHVLNKIDPKFFCSLKAAGGTSKVYSTAAILADESIEALFVLDDDRDGKREKKAILENLRKAYTSDNVVTIKDLVNDLPRDSMLEDLMPVDFVKDHFEEELSDTLTVDPAKAIINQFKAQNELIKTNKQKLNSVKYKLSEKFIAIYNTKAKLETDSPKMAELGRQIIAKFQS